MSIVFSKMEVYTANIGVDLKTIQEELMKVGEKDRKPNQASRLHQELGISNLVRSSYLSSHDNSLESETSASISQSDTRHSNIFVTVEPLDQYLLMFT